MRQHSTIVFDMTQQRVLMCRSRRHYYFPSYTTQTLQHMWLSSLRCLNDENIRFSYCPSYYGTMIWGKHHYHIYSTATILVHHDQSSSWICIDVAPYRKMLYAALIKIRLQYSSQHVTLDFVYFSSHTTMSDEEAFKRIINNTHEIAPTHTVMTVPDFYRHSATKHNRSWKAVLEVLVVR